MEIFLPARTQWKFHSVQRKERRRKKQLVFILNEQNESHLVTFCSMHVHDKQKHYIMVRLFDMTDVF